MSLSLYQLKPGFQSLLRPSVRLLARRGVTANQVTLLACAVSVALGVALYADQARHPAWFALVPVWMLARMALNAVDGMLAREHGQQSVLGAYLNELTDVLSDAALYLPFACLGALPALGIGLLVLLSAMSEMAGLQGLTVRASRRYDGPMGKSDRAFVFGAMGLAVALWGTLPDWTAWVLHAMVALTALNIVNRVRAGIAEQQQQVSP
ncbi:CDP-alcohol phosphatidyltransferase family protein [Aquabacterium sp.]|uniref:CDP-alcohol phosphatidyltransferase family protein n=1 Tax=Aquabacterium sp. TaxID=1872578 RepID=UPI003D6CD4AB